MCQIHNETIALKLGYTRVKSTILQLKVASRYMTWRGKDQKKNTEQ